MKNKNKITSTTVFSIVIIIIIFCIIFQISIFTLPDYIYYLFNKDNEKISIDKDVISIVYTGSKDNYGDEIDCNNIPKDLSEKMNIDCYIPKPIKYLYISGTSYNSFSKIYATLNDKKVLKVEQRNRYMHIFTDEFYKMDEVAIRMENTKYLKQGLNKITFSGNNKVDTIYFYYQYVD